MKTVASGENYTTVTVDTAEAVKFSFASTSLSVKVIEGEITVALTETAQAGDDGTITVSKGETEMFNHYRMNVDTYYLTGSGKAVLHASNMTDVNPFEGKGKGGDGGGDNTHYKGTTTTALENGSTTNPIVIDGESYTAVFGDVVVYGYTEFVFDGTQWSEFGRPFDTVPTQGSTNAVTSDGVYRNTAGRKYFVNGVLKGEAFNDSNAASASRSHAEGSGTTASGGCSHSEGLNSTASGANSHAEGNRSKASGDHSHAEGSQTIASGLASHAGGVYTIANKDYSTAIGRYNVADTDVAHLLIVGNGTAENARSNILEVSETDMNVNGDIKINSVAIPIPYTTMPSIAESMLGQIAMYVGTTGNGYTQGCFYIASTDGAAEPTYSWVQIGEDSVARAKIAEVEAYIGYNDDTIVGLCADFENNTFTRLAGAVGKSAGIDFNVFNMYGGRKLCNLADDGTVNAWYGDDNYTEDGSNGQVMVYQPKFYYKVVPLKLQKNTDYKGAKGYHILKANYYLSDTPKAGFKVHPAFINGNGDEIDGIYIGAYEGSIYDTSESEYLKYDSWDVTDNGDDTYTINNYDGHLADVTATTGDKLSSISGVKPAGGEFSNLTRPNAEVLAANRGTGWHSINIQVAMMEMLLFIVEYGMFNTQTAIASGVVNLASGTHNEGVFTGSTASLGNGSGMAASTSRLITNATEYSTTTTNGTTSIRYRGVENDWGDLWKYIIGTNIWGNGSMGGGEVYINSDYTYTDGKHDGNYAGVGFTLANEDGYIKYIGYGSEEFDWVMLCSKTGGSSALPVGDYLYKAINLNGYRICLLGGGWYLGARAGGFYLSANNGLGRRTRDIGSRLLYISN